MFNYNSYLSEQLQHLKNEGRYRYFLEVNKSAQHFPDFYYANTEGVQRSAVNWCSNDYLCMSTRDEDQHILTISFIKNILLNAN